MKTFEHWIESLKAIMLSKWGFTEFSVKTVDAEAFRCYFDDGLTPDEAMIEEAQAAN